MTDRVHAAADAIHRLAMHKVMELPFLMRGAAQNALSEAVCLEFAKVALDAADKFK